MAVLVPSPATLKKYGLSEAEWRAHLDFQGGVCFVCELEPKKGRLCIDHEHVKGWKKMPPEQRKRFVRGLLCWVCNSHYLFRGITVRRSQRVTEYLEVYSKRRPSTP
jgi:Recombination endonuclease VII.